MTRLDGVVINRVFNVPIDTIGFGDVINIFAMGNAMGAFDGFVEVGLPTFEVAGEGEIFDSGLFA